MSDQPTERSRRRLASRLLQVPASRLSVRDLPDLDATLIVFPVRGGASVIVADGTDGPAVLYGTSAISAPLLIEEFRQGRRTPLEHFEGIAEA